MTSPDSHVSRFARLFGPPPQDGTPVAIAWAAVESWLGLRLPADYKAIASAYGPLDIGEHLWLHVPCAPTGAQAWYDYGRWLEEERREAPGVLPFAETRTSDVLYWDTTASDDPDAWPVVMLRRDADSWVRFGTPLLPALERLVAEGLRPTLARTAYLTELDPAPWTPPPPRPAPTPEQRAALAQGAGLETLTALVPPPATPFLGDRTWEWLYERLGTRLPTEYVQLMETYGAGCWTEWLRFSVPLGTDQYDLAPWAEWYHDTYRGHRERYPEFNPLRVWPEAGGFLPFANSIDGDQLCWLTEGDSPDDWPLIVVPRHAKQGPPLTGTLTGILLEWLRGRFRTEGLPGLGRPDEDPLDYIGFEPRTRAAN
ncbi:MULTISPECIES: SMI1/KNR4 family protein [unclassified Streptomyces]|uniref:SMI1/KNR4 family protein n=1 Tax=unclassified Streptomyces TaxID=2593676 RepID=UPI00339EAAE9